jgi:hypothetical protein
MFNQKVFTLLGMWLNGGVLPCHAQGPGFNTRHQEKKRGRREGEKEKTFYKHLARLYLQTPSIESFTRFASVSTQRLYSQKTIFIFFKNQSFKTIKMLK